MTYRWAMSGSCIFATLVKFFSPLWADNPKLTLLLLLGKQTSGTAINCRESGLSNASTASGITSRRLPFEIRSIGEIRR